MLQPVYQFIKEVAFLEDRFFFLSSQPGQFKKLSKRSDYTFFIRTIL